MLLALPIFYLFQQPDTKSTIEVTSPSIELEAQPTQQVHPTDANPKTQKPISNAIVKNDEQQHVVESNTELSQRLQKTHPSAIQERIFVQDPIIKRVRFLTKTKVLLSQTEIRELEHIVSDPANIEKYRQILKSSLSTTHFHDQQLYRLFAINFLEEGLKRNSLTQRKAINDIINELVLSENIEQGLPTRSKKSLAYEKVKLLEMLRRVAPKEFARLSSRAACR